MKLLDLEVIGKEEVNMNVSTKKLVEYLQDNTGNLSQKTIDNTMINILDQLVNPTLDVKFAKLHPEARIPTYAKFGDAGLDLTAISVSKNSMGQLEYNTGLAVEVPVGHVGLLFPRSSVSNTSLSLSNCVGVIDSGYRGSITAKFTELHSDGKVYAPGDRVVQLIILPYPKVFVSQCDIEDLSVTDRGVGGWGSSGR